MSKGYAGLGEGWEWGVWCPRAGRQQAVWCAWLRKKDPAALRGVEGPALHNKDLANFACKINDYQILTG